MTCPLKYKKVNAKKHKKEIECSCNIEEKENNFVFGDERKIIVLLMIMVIAIFWE